tara:strand:+ start:259 stop:528 length:270 start_codon:yes stop_codon:yes gene_type:complete
MKKENLVFSFIVVACAACLIFLAGWVMSFMIGVDVDATTKEGEPVSDALIMIFRFLIGSFAIGLMVTIDALWKLFKYCMINAPTNNEFK